VPVHSLLGGKRQDQIKLFEMISRTDPDVMADRVAEYRELGFRGFQMKVGENPATDVERFRKVAAAMQPGEMMDADAYTGWAQHDAIRVVDAVSHLVVNTIPAFT